MTEILLYTVLGLGAGSLFAALAQGLVLAYRGAGVINLAHGAMALYVAYTFAGLRQGRLMLPPFPFVPGFVNLGGPVDTLPALVISLVVAAVLGLAMHVLVFRWLRAVPPLAKTVAAVGIMLLLQSVVVLRFGTDGLLVPAVLPSGSVQVADVSFPVDRVVFFGIVVVLAIGLTLLFKLTRLGLATRAASENERGAVLLGLSPDRLAAVNWVLSSIVAGTAGIVLASFSGLNPIDLVLYVIPAVAAGLLARFESFVLASIYGVLLGVIQSFTVLLQSKVDWFPTSATALIPLLAIVIAMIVSGRNLPERGSLLQIKLPASPEPRHVGRWVAVLSVLTVVGLLFLPFDLRGGLMISMVGAILALSMVVIAGFAGQISLMQMTLAAVAALAMTRLAGDLAIPFPLSGILAVVAATVVGVVLGLPALRVRGVQLAALTLGAAYAFEQVVLGDPMILRVEDASSVPPPSLFGVEFGISSGFPFLVTGPPSPAFGLFLLVITIGCFLAVVRLRRSDRGRQFLAVRSNERAAASLGVNVAVTKLVAFGIGSALAGVAGVLFAYQYEGMTREPYIALASVQVLAIAYVGGISTASGAVIAGLSIAGGFIPRLVEHWTELGNLQPVILGVMLLGVVVLHPEGFDSVIKQAGAAIRRRATRLLSRGSPPVAGRPGESLTASTEAR